MTTHVGDKRGTVTDGRSGDIDGDGVSDLNIALANVGSPDTSDFVA